MEGETIIRQFNELIYQDIQNYINYIDASKHAKTCRNMLCLCTGVYNKAKVLIEKLGQMAPDTHLIIVGREKTVNTLKKENIMNCSWVIWEEEFSLSILDKDCINAALGRIDGMIFLCREVNDLRDFNLFDIATRLRAGTKIFGSIGGEQLVQYTDLDRYLACIRCYDAVMQWFNACSM